MMEGVYVCHMENEEEVHVSFVEGICQIELYSAHTKIYFVDRMGNRYRSGIEYALESYLDEEKFRNFCLEHVKDERRVYVKWIISEQGLEEEQPDRLLVEEDELDNWKQQEEKDDLLLNMAHRNFMYRRYNKEMLIYLRNYFEGRVFDLLDLWSSLKKEELLTAEFENRVLNQIAFVGSKDERMPEVLLSYLEKSEDEELAEIMMETYSVPYLVHGLHMDSERKVTVPEQYFAILDRQAEKDKLRSVMNRLAYLYHKAEAGYGEKDYITIRNMIREFCQQEIVFPFFVQFERLITIPSLWKESVCFWFMSEEKGEYNLSVVSDFGEDCRKSKVPMREIAPGFYYGNSYFPFFESILQMSIPEYGGSISVQRITDYIPGSRSHLLSKMSEEKSMAASWMADYEKIMGRMKEQLKFLSDR